MFRLMVTLRFPAAAGHLNIVVFRDVFRQLQMLLNDLRALIRRLLDTRIVSGVRLLVEFR